MVDNGDVIKRLAAEFTKLPSVGLRTAYRYAYSILKMDKEDVQSFANTIIDVRENVHYCKLCGNYSAEDICPLCLKKDKSIICVVSESKDIQAIEKTNSFNGVYHILGGELSPRNKIGPSELRIKELLERLEGVNEIILATNPSSEGDVTAVYLANLIKPFGIKVTRIASGVPIGSNIEYADEVTLSRAFNGRKEI